MNIGMAGWPGWIPMEIVRMVMKSDGLWLVVIVIVVNDRIGLKTLETFTVLA